jgi:hypothetical protein
MRADGPPVAVENQSESAFLPGAAQSVSVPPEVSSTRGEYPKTRRLFVLLLAVRAA